MFFIRHGQSEFNVVHHATGRDPGIADAPLSDLGAKQVRAAAERLIGSGITTILSSPYTRALQTASIVAETIKAPIRVEPLVGEYRVYSCDIGSPLAQLKDQFPHVDFDGMTDGAWWEPFQEPRHDFKKRVEAFRHKWLATPSNGALLAVSHYYFIEAVTGCVVNNAEIVKIR